MRPTASASEREIPLNRDEFMRTLIRELSGVLQDVVGLDEASGFVSVVGLKIGRYIDAMYREAYDQDTLTRDQVADVLVDLKRRIEGDFYLIEKTEERIVLGNRACPFGTKVVGRPALCMMTSNVFGSITAENLGYAKVQIDAAIANGDPECRIVVHLKATRQANNASGQVYFKSHDSD